MNKVRKIHILLVDDDEDDVLLAKRALAKTQLTSHISIVNDGTELLDYIDRRGSYADEEQSPIPDLILLDLNMPKMNGKEALKALRAHKKYRHLPVVVFTTSQAEQDIVEAYKLGANSYVKKPGDFQGLVEVMAVIKTYWMRHVTLPPRI